MTYLLDSAPAPRPDTLRLPSEPPPRRRGGLPIAAALVPVVGAVAMWAITGSTFALWFAALGPLMAVAALVDGARGTRRDGRRYRRELLHAVAEARSQIDAQHDVERDARWLAHPDVLRLTSDASSIWRVVPARRGTVTLGSGRVLTDWDVLAGDSRDEALALRSDAKAVPDAPLVIAWREGVYVRGPERVARAVARAYVLQLCLSHAPSDLRVTVGDPAEAAWAAALPHVQVDAAGDQLVLLGPSEQPAQGSRVDGVIAWGSAEVVPSGCAVVVDLSDGLVGTVEHGGRRVDIDVEAVSRAQAIAVTAALRDRAVSAAPDDDPVLFADIREHPVVGALGAMIGAEAGTPVGLDLVTDGPHAVVVGTTGAGKSELLCTWALALAYAHPPEDVALLLVDFKGGMAFDALRSLPHVTGVLTDLDGGGARRAVESLRAEIRRRERAIADAGARDVGDARTGLERLVIVVDEFGALLQQHPDLDAVFADVAARGRALGMHLVLGSQRAAGAIRDHILTNCALRIALRVADATDSRTVIDADDAARLPGGPAGRGIAFIRRAGDPSARRTRIALTHAADRSAAAHRWPVTVTPSPPWLPPLPAEIDQADLPAADGAIALGLIDDPEAQRQHPALLRPGTDRGLCIVGGVGSGTSNVARLITSSWPGAVLLSADAPEVAWDALTDALDDPSPIVVCDDVDRLIGIWGDTWGRDGAERLEELVRTRRDTTVVLTAHRITGALIRVADLLPRRAVLRSPSRGEHIALGGTGESWDPQAPPGRGLLDGKLVQFALAGPTAASPAPVRVGDAWRPGMGPTGLVLRGGRRRAARLAADWGVPVTVVDDLDPCRIAPGAPLPPTVLLGDGEAWQRAWHMLQRLRADGDIVVGVECMTELRTLLGERSLPPYTASGGGWLISGGDQPRRLRLD